MPNLLPEKNKKEIFNEFLLRFLVVFLVFSFFTICIAASALVPSYVLSFAKETSVKSENQKFDKVINSKEDISPTILLGREREKLEIISNFSENGVINLFLKIIEDKPDSVKIVGLFYDRSDKEGEEVVLIIKGTATDRNILVDYVDRLEKENNFAEVDFPVSNLIQGEEVDFSVKISTI